MEKQLSYVLKLSLEEIALRRVAVLLWSHPHVLASLQEFTVPLFGSSNFKYCFSQCWLLNDWLEERMSTLRLPVSLKEKMKLILKAVGSEISTWKFFHEAYLSEENFDVHVFEKFYWTTAGTVDYRKTAEKLVRCDVVDIVKRFDLACLYCLENCILLLWAELPEENRKTFYNEEVTSRVETPQLHLFLPYILKKQSKMENIHLTFSPRNSFEESALCGNKTLAEYCFWKLTKEEREASLVRTAKDVIKCRNDLCGYPFGRQVIKGKLSDVFCYLLSLMTPEDQIEIFKELPCEVLRCFLDWPWQDLFLDNADVIWTFLPESRYKDLLDTIYNGMSKSGYNSQNLFQNFLLRSPVEFRKHFVDGLIRNDCFFWDFFINKDEETIKVIFRNADAADRVRLVSSQRGLKFIYDWSNEWHVKEAFLREATLSKEDKGRLKEAFIEFARREKPKYEDSIDLVRRDYIIFFEFLEETDARAQSNRS